MAKSVDVLVSKDRPAHVEVPLRRRGTIDGFVEDLTNEALLKGVTVRLWDSERTLVGIVKTDAYGEYRFEGVKAGAYALSVDLPRGYTAERPEIPLHVPSAAELEANFELRVAGLVRGRVVNEDTAEPLEGVAVELLDSRGRRVGAGATGPDGAYEFTNLPEDKYTVRVGE